MSPHQALESSEFLFYASAAACLLLVGGVTLTFFRRALRKDPAHAWRAYRGWLAMVPLLLVTYFLGRQACIVFVTAIACLGFREFAAATGLGRDRVLTATALAGIVAGGIACLLPDP